MNIKLDNPPKNLNELLLKHIITDTVYHLYDAHKKYPTHPSLEHSLCVLEEEISELREAIYNCGKDDRDWATIYNEAYQVAAMALRLLSDSVQRNINGTYIYE